jgi:SPP1 family predicted phage head-tail adaptor
MNRIGPMRHRIDIQRLTRTTNPSTGVVSETWATVHESYPASVRALSARELQAAGARQSEATVEFEMRADVTVNPDDRILFEGDVYDIEPPQLDPTRRRFYRIKASRNLTNG